MCGLVQDCVSFTISYLLKESILIHLLHQMLALLLILFFLSGVLLTIFQVGRGFVEFIVVAARILK
jgi:hypothetical protein